MPVDRSPVRGRTRASSQPQAPTTETLPVRTVSSVNVDTTTTVASLMPATTMTMSAMGSNGSTNIRGSNVVIGSDEFTSTLSTPAFSNLKALNVQVSVAPNSEVRLNEPSLRTLDESVQRSDEELVRRILPAIVEVIRQALAGSILSPPAAQPMQSVMTAPMVYQPHMLNDIYSTGCTRLPNSDRLSDASAEING